MGGSAGLTEAGAAISGIGATKSGAGAGPGAAAATCGWWAMRLRHLLKGTYGITCHTAVLPGGLTAGCHSDILLHPPGLIY